jgi:hypothetical protein
VDVAIRGSCHCGNVSFELSWKAEPAQIAARACDCSFCVKHGGLWTSHPDARVEVRIEDPARVEKYAFGTRTADFHICRGCGVVPIVTSEIDGRLYAVVSVSAFDGIDKSRIKAASISFDGEGAASRLDRRKRNWIGDVTFVPAGARAPAGAGA